MRKIMTNFKIINAPLIKIFLLGIILSIPQLSFAKSAGLVTFVTGDATITHADKSTISAAKNAELNSGDTIETRDGRLQLSLIDGGKVSLQPNSIYKINKYEYSGSEDGSEYGFTELVKGGLRTISGAIGHKNRDRYQLKTAVATIGIRGTEFTVNYNNNNLLMTTNYGSVDVCTANGCLNAITGQSIEVAGAGNAPKRSLKAATAAAASPNSSSTKPVFASSDLINDAGFPSVVAANLPLANDNPTPPVTPVTPVTPVLPVLPVLPVINSVVGNALFIATDSTGSLVNDVYRASLTFDGAGNLINVENNPSIKIKPLSFNSLNKNDTIISWGQASAGSFKANGNNFAINQADYIAGVAPNPAIISSLTGTYNVFASTAPFIVSNGLSLPIGAINTVTGPLVFDFRNGTYNYNLNVPTTIDTFILSGSGIGLNASNPTFESAGSVTSTGLTCATGCSGALNTGKLVQGSFYGANGERAGLQYGITPVFGSAIYGGAVLR